MQPHEAIVTLEGLDISCNDMDALEVALTAFKEELARSIPITPTILPQKSKYTVYNCPDCNHGLSYLVDRYCPNCGRRLDWSAILKGWGATLK